MNTTDQSFETAKYILTERHAESRLLVSQLRNEAEAAIRRTVLQRLRTIRDQVFISYCRGGYNISIVFFAMQFATDLNGVLTDNGIRESLHFSNPEALRSPVGKNEEQKIILA